MNSKTILIIIAVIGGIYIFTNGADKDNIVLTPQEVKSRPAFIVVMDDSGVLSEPARAGEQKLKLLAQLKALNNRRKFAHAQVQIISTSYGRTVWVGKIADLKTARAEELVQKIAANAQHCNKLGQSFMAAKSAISKLEQQGFNRIHLVFFSSLIATPAPCSKSSSITLPQLPVKVDFENILTHSTALSSLSFYYVNPHQLRPYRQAMEPVRLWAQTSDVRFNMFDMEETAFHLNNGLAGVK